jgi:type II secretory pathway component PulC
VSRAFRSSANRARVEQPLISAVRPGVEAAVLAAVAFGCAHAGWAILTPPAFGSLDERGSDGAWNTGVSAYQTNDDAVLVSPFAPEAAVAAGGSSAASAFASTVQLVGVRMSEEPARSGAIVVMQDGSQRAFMVGQELSAGVRLSRVTPGGISLSFEGGEREVSLASPPETFSFAAAMMGRVEAPADVTLAALSYDAPLVAVDGHETPTPFASASRSVEVEPNMLSAAMAPVQGAPGSHAIVQYLSALVAAQGGAIPADGLRLSGPLPSSIAAMGLQEGDVVIAINGVGAQDAPSLLSAGVSGPLEFTVRRAAGAPMLVRART